MVNVAYAYINKRFTDISSSGGAFLGIVESFFCIDSECNHSVYGAMFDSDFHVIHGRAETLEESKIFTGSKYVESVLGDTFKSIENDLDRNYKVLFSGTPCQVAALINRFKDKDTSNLLTVDIVCHGTPKKEFWEDYKEYIESQENSKLLKFTFRHKPAGWKGYPTYAEFDSGKKYINSYKCSGYITLFRQDLLTRSGCFNCVFPGNYKSDITIADFWGIEKCMPDVNTKSGVSLMIFHSECKNIKEHLKQHSELFREITDQSYLNYNHNLQYKTSKPRNYEKFWSDYKENGIEYVLKLYGGINPKGKIKFYTTRFLRNTGLMQLAKDLLKRV